MVSLSTAACGSPPEERLNVFALVIYIPDPLGRFLDDLRRELAPAYNPHAHVSVLPPRSLTGDWRDASDQVRALTESRPPFDIELANVDIFPATNVIYLEVGKGATELKRMHHAMNQHCSLHFDERFDYHPHITLAQDITEESVAALLELASRRWAEFTGPRTFRAGHAVFVQSTSENCWIDLAEYSFGAVAAKI